jgi:hypothetical protein
VLLTKKAQARSRDTPTPEIYSPVASVPCVVDHNGVDHSFFLLLVVDAGSHSAKVGRVFAGSS